jgi:hypothetical protein
MTLSTEAAARQYKMRTRIEIKTFRETLALSSLQCCQPLKILCLSCNFLKPFSNNSLWRLADNGSEAMASTSISNMAYTTTGEKIFSSLCTICRLVYPDRCQRTSAHQEPPVHPRKEAYSPLAYTMFKHVHTAG